MPKETHETLWPGWDTVGVIGRGSFGAVYKIERDVMGHKEQAALKHISIPKSESDINDLIADGYDEDSITLRFREYLKDIIQEYSTMSEIKGCANIVYAEDVRYVQHDDGIGWDIYIRMELLTPLNEALTGTVDEQQVLRIGKDLCNALSFCEQKNILHRDIKPQNIFVAPDGTYKLGDFGIAKVSDRTTSGTTAGTFSYMSPEVFNHQPYGPKADLYSLGLVLYWLLNDRRTPFLPLTPQVPTAANADSTDNLVRIDKTDTGDKTVGLYSHHHEEWAWERRFQGDALPPPAHGSPALQAVVLKACAFRPEDRYRNAAEMLAELQRLERTGSNPGPGPVKRGRTKPFLIAAVAIGCAVVVGLGLFAGLSRSGGKENSQPAEISAPTATVMPSEPAVITPELTPEPTPEPTVEPLAFSEYAGSMSGYRRLYFSSAAASSSLAETPTLIHGPENAIDGLLESSWVEGVEGHGIGEYIILFLDGEDDLDMLSLRLGYVHNVNRNNYLANNRPSQLQFDFSDGSQAIYSFEDRNEEHHIVLNRPVSTSYVKITILGVYAGNVDDDTCITEIEAYQARP